MAREPIIYVNREFVPQSEARISVLDHAVLYGDGIFETALRLRRPHLQARRAYRARFPLDGGDRARAAVRPRETMRALIVETVRRNGLADAYIKWIVTRGSNGRPLMDPTGCEPNLIILVQPYIKRATDERIAEGLRLKTVAVRRPPGQVLDPQIKSINYLNLVLAKLEAKAAGADEALLLDLNGRVCEATGCNVFVVKGRQLRTPRHDILQGITRETVFELAPAADLAAEACDLELYDAYTADEMFICEHRGRPAARWRMIDGRRDRQRPARPGVPRAAMRPISALVSSEKYGTPVPA